MQLSETVQQFIIRYISSVDQLEILLLLKAHSTREWNAEDVARELFTQADSAEFRLAELAGHGLLSRKNIDERETYQYNPRDGILDRTVTELAAEYPKYRVSIINLIFSKPIDKIRTFADAFRFKKEDDGEEDEK